MPPIDQLKKRMIQPKPKQEKLHYDTSGNVVYRYNALRITLKVVVIVGIVFAVLAAAIYTPQLFMRDPEPVNDLITKPDPSGYSNMRQYIRSHSDMDYDNDGLTNGEEIKIGTNVFFADSDLDGLNDSIDKKANKKDKKAVLNALKVSNGSRKTPYSMDGVILWPQNNKAWSQGTVILTQEGYKFTNFKGYAKFPEGNVPYVCKDGRHTPLPYKADVDAYKISEDCIITLTNEKKEQTYQIGLFGKEWYIRNGFGKFLNWLLPEKGWLTAKSMWVDDTFNNYNTVTVDYAPPESYVASDSRFEYYSYDLDDLAMVYTLLDEGYYVHASILSEDQGESIVVIFGYTASGDLLAVDPDVTQIGVIDINIQRIRCVNNDNRVSEFSFFTFSGCGYQEEEKPLIAFYSAGSVDEKPEVNFRKQEAA